jgi:hypothetical protein
MPLTETFKVRADDGAEFTVTSFQSAVDTGKHDQHDSFLALATYRLTNGFRLKMIDKNTFTVAKTGKTLRRVKPVE